jgi:hypothetical protein
MPLSSKSSLCADVTSIDIVFFSGVFHTIISIVILGLSAYLFSKFHRNFDPLAHVYLFDLIVSALAIAGGILICMCVHISVPAALN